jgi:hypothetical protein
LFSLFRSTDGNALKSLVGKSAGAVGKVVTKSTGAVGKAVTKGTGRVGKVVMKQTKQLAAMPDSPEKRTFGDNPADDGADVVEPRKIYQAGVGGTKSMGLDMGALNSRGIKSLDCGTLLIILLF